MSIIRRARTTRTVIKCPECNRKFYSGVYGRESAADGCDCGNIDIGIAEALPDSEYEFFVMTYYLRTPPEIYDEPLPPKEEVTQPEHRIGFHQDEEK
jgi:hypothetical protein